MRSKKFTFHLFILLGALCFTCFGASRLVAQDSVAIHNLGHSSIHMEYKDLHIYVDPYSAVVDFDTMPKADLIFVTHGHPDHYDLTALNKLKTDNTILVTSQAVNDLGTYDGNITVLDNGDSTVVMDLPVKAVPAYNVFNTTYHPKGVGNGYVFTFGEKKIYVAGDTENIAEMRLMGKIDIAFLPMNLPYTMTPAEVFTAALNIRPEILYVYHYGASDTLLVRALLQNYIHDIRIGPSTYYESDEQDKTPNEEVFQSAELVFYPNPVKDVMVVSNLKPGTEIAVYDLLGKLILKRQMTGFGDQQLNLKALDSGVYLLKYQDKDMVISNKFLKE